MTEFRKYKLGELCTDISYGYTESAKQEKIGPKFLRITDIQNDHIDWSTVPYCPITDADYKKYKLDIGDIVIARTGNSTGATSTIKDDTEAVFASYLIRFRLDRKIANPFYVDFVLRSPLWQNFVEAIKGGSAQPGANAKQFSEFEFDLPNLSTQALIASILSPLDDKIELNRRTNITLEQMAAVIFQKYFVNDIDPDNLPEGWRFDKLDNYISSISKTHKFPKNEIIFLNTSDILEGKVLNNSYSNVEGLPGQAKKSILKNDILFSEIRPGNKRYAYINFEAEDYVVSTKLMVLRSITEINSLFFYFILTQPEMLSYLQNIAESRSGTFPQITFDQIKDIDILIPEMDFLTHFIESTLRPAYQLIFNNQKEIETLSKIRTRLLPQLMSGEIIFTNVNQNLQIDEEVPS